MNNLERKCLNEVLSVTNSIDTTMIYMAVSEFLEKEKIDQGIKNGILKTISVECSESIVSKIRNIKEWLETILNQEN